MDKKKILITSYMFSPMGGGGVMRVKSLSEYLIREGWDVTIFTQKANKYNYDVYDTENKIHPELTIITPYGNDKNRTLSNAAKQNSTTSKPPVSAFKKLKRLVKNTLRKIILSLFPDTVIDYFIKGTWWAYKTELKFDVVLASIRPPSNALVAYFYSVFKNKPLVVEYRDLWFGQEFQDESSWYTFLNKIYENKILKRADKIVCLSPRYIEVLKNRYPRQSQKMILLTNGFTKDYFEASNIDTDFKKKNPEKISIAHFGRFYGPRKIDSVLKTLKNIQDKIEFYHFGPNIENSNCDFEQLDFFDQGGYLSFNKSWSIQQTESVDILLLIEYTSDNIPGKVFEYYASGKPVIIICPTESVIRDVFANIPDFYFIESGKEERLLKVIDDLELKDSKKRNIDLKNDVFFRDNIYKEYFKTFNKIT